MSGTWRNWNASGHVRPQSLLTQSLLLISVKVMLDSQCSGLCGSDLMNSLSQQLNSPPIPPMFSKAPQLCGSKHLLYLFNFVVASVVPLIFVHKYYDEMFSCHHCGFGAQDSSQCLCSLLSHIRGQRGDV